MTITFTNEDFHAACRGDFLTFAEAAWEIVNPGKSLASGFCWRLIADHLERATTGEIKRLGICLPPRYGKSYLVSIAYPAWLLGQDPSKQIVCVSYAHDLAEQHAGDCKTLMMSEFYKAVFPETRIDVRHTADMNFMTTRRGRRIATTVEGTVTGRGGQFILVDDPMKPADAYSDRRRQRTHLWWDNTLIQRLDSKLDDVVITVMQRVHVDDTIARLKAKGTFQFLELPAIATHDETYRLRNGTVCGRKAGEPLDPDREPLEVLAAIRDDITPEVFETQYQQNPSAGEQAVIQWDDIARYDPARETFRTIPGEDHFLVSWDTAVKTGDRNDWSVGAVFFVQRSHMPPGYQSYRKARLFLVEVIRAKMEFPDLIARMIDVQRQYRPKQNLIEDTLNAPAVAATLRDHQVRNVELIRSSGDKRSRLYSQAGWFHRKQVLFPTQAPWLTVLREEWLPFPHGVHDDQVDAISQALTYLYEMGERATVVHHV